MIKTKKNLIPINLDSSLSIDTSDVPDANDWVFAPIGAGGVGSRVFRENISSHPEIMMLDEHNLLSQYYYYTDGDETVVVSNIREILEIDRKEISESRLFGEKSIQASTRAFWHHQIFPGCKIIILHRNYLDAFASRFPISEEEMKHRDHCNNRIRNIIIEFYLEPNTFWKDNSDNLHVVYWKDMKDRDRAKAAYIEIFEFLGVDPEAVDFDDITNRLRHSLSKTDWQKSEVMTQFVDWLANEDPELTYKLINSHWHL